MPLQDQDFCLSLLKVFFRENKNGIEAEEYCELVLAPKYAVTTKFENADQQTACGCFIF